jgi:hypothetical protein
MLLSTNWGRKNKISAVNLHQVRELTLTENDSA